jgi:hypothetical protein
MSAREGGEGRSTSHRHRRIGEGDAYDVMSSVGVDPSSPAIDVHRAGMSAQRSAGARSSEYREAWAELRNSERRLFLDLGFVHVPASEHPDESHSILELEPSVELEPAALPTLTVLVQALGPPPGSAALEGAVEFATPAVNVDVWALAEELLQPLELPERPVAAVGCLLEEI